MLSGGGRKAGQVVAPAPARASRISVPSARISPPAHSAKKPIMSECGKRARADCRSVARRLHLRPPPLRAPRERSSLRATRRSPRIRRGGAVGTGRESGRRAPGGPRSPRRTRTMTAGAIRGYAVEEPPHAGHPHAPLGGQALRWGWRSDRAKLVRRGPLDDLGRATRHRGTSRRPGSGRAPGAGRLRTAGTRVGRLSTRRPPGPPSTGARSWTSSARRPSTSASSLRSAALHDPIALATDDEPLCTDARQTMREPGVMRFLP